MTDKIAYSLGIAAAIFGVLFLGFVIGALGLVGAEGDTFDILYFGVVTALISGSIVARLKAAGMARALFATALVQFLILLIALASGKQNDPTTSSAELVGLNAMFMVIFLVSAFFFRSASRTQANV